MMSPICVVTLPVCFTFVVCLLLAQYPQSPPDPEPSTEPRLPNGRLQKDAILKADHGKNLEDAQELIKLSTELKTDLEKDTQYVYSITTVKKTEEIEKVARRIRGRLKRM
jgi:hypothetical protein